MQQSAKHKFLGSFTILKKGEYRLKLISILNTLQPAETNQQQLSAK